MSRKRHLSKNTTWILPVEYYQRPFLLFNNQITRSRIVSTDPHPIRERFWTLLPQKTYSQFEAITLLRSYLSSVEDLLATIISKQSIGYWMHIYRRIFPDSIGINQEPLTIGLTRASLEAAIQKYARFSPCNKVGISELIPVENVLAGLLMAPEYKMEREIVNSASQLVLTDFGIKELIDFYNLEKLAYEVWRTSAMLRIVGKGAPIRVTSKPHFVIDQRSQELATLVERYDYREGRYLRYFPSATGVITDTLDSNSGYVFQYSYNLGKIPANEFNAYFKNTFNLEMDQRFIPNFISIPMNMRNWRNNHQPFSDAFLSKNHVSLDSVLLVLTSILHRAFLLQVDNAPLNLHRYWQRAYEGPIPREFVVEEIMQLIPDAAQILDITEKPTDTEIMNGIKYLELSESNKKEIDVAFPGPHFIFLPFGDDRIFIDYAWIPRRLYDLFLGVNLQGVNQNFKGDLLEQIVRFRQLVLPTKPCKSLDGKQKQIDASFNCNDRLIIVECKAFGKSIELDRGNPNAISRRSDMVTQALIEVDKKGYWLQQNPFGRNYDIRRYKEILPLLVTPFTEFIPRIDSFYWLDEKTPRIMTPAELENFLEDGFLENIPNNLITLPRE